MSLRDFWMYVYLAAIREGQQRMTAKQMADKAISDWKESWEMPR